MVTWPPAVSLISTDYGRLWWLVLGPAKPFRSESMVKRQAHHQGPPLKLVLLQLGICEVPHTAHAAVCGLASGQS